MDDEYQQHAADHGVEGGQGENGEDAPRGDSGAQGLGMKRGAVADPLQGQREKDKFLDNAVYEDDQGYAAADRGQEPFQAEAGTEKEQRQQEEKISQANVKKPLDLANRIKKNAAGTMYQPPFLINSDAYFLVRGP
jgi:hypothetical protein